MDSFKQNNLDTKLNWQRSTHLIFNHWLAYIATKNARDVELTLLSLAIRDLEVGTAVSLVGASIELLVARALKSGVEVNESGAIDAEWLDIISGVNDRSSGATKVAVEGLKVSLAGIEHARIDGSRKGNADNGGDGELHFGKRIKEWQTRPERDGKIKKR